MSSTGLEIIERSAQTAHEWINELAARLDYTSKARALRLLRIVLHVVRDHLLPDEMAQFSAQLPLLIRGMFFEGWVPKRTPLKDRSLEGFVEAVDPQFEDDEEFRGIADTKYVFELLNAHISIGEINDVRASMPSEIRNFWPSP